MGLRTTTTQRQRRLGAELRKLREQAGLTVSEGGALIGMGRVHLTHVESGRTAIPTDRLRTLCASYGFTSTPYVEALISLSEGSSKGWWSEYKEQICPSALDLAELEASADALHSYESLFIPGLFQTEDYIRAIFQSADSINGCSDVETAVRFRMERQKILDGQNGPDVHAVIHEAALHVRCGSTAVMRKQLLHLMELAALPNLTIQILPFAAEGLSKLSTPFLIVTSHDAALETVLMEHPAQSMYMHDQQSITMYRKHFDRLRNAALPPVDVGLAPNNHARFDSLRLIQYVLYSL